MTVLRRIGSILLVGVGSLSLVTGVAMMWFDDHVFDTDHVVATTETVLGDPSVRELVHREVTTRIVAETDPLYEPVVAAAVTLVLDDPRFTEIVSDSVRVSHRTLVDGNQPEITFSLNSIWPVVVEELDAIDPAISPLLPDLSQSLDFELTDRAELPWLWDFVDRFHRAAVALSVFGAALIGLGLVIGPSRWALLIVLGLGLVVFGLGVTSGARLAERQVDDRVGDATERAVADSVLPLFTTPLEHRTTQLVALGGIIAAIGLAIRLLRPLTRRPDARDWQQPSPEGGLPQGW